MRKTLDFTCECLPTPDGQQWCFLSFGFLHVHLPWPQMSSSHFVCAFDRATPQSCAVCLPACPVCVQCCQASGFRWVKESVFCLFEGLQTSLARPALLLSSFLGLTASVAGSTCYGMLLPGPRFARCVFRCLSCCICHTPVILKVLHPPPTTLERTECRFGALRGLGL